MHKKSTSSQLDADTAKEIIKRLYKDPSNWKSRKFRQAYCFLTGQEKIPSEEEAKTNIERLIRDQYRNENPDYVSAMLLISGKWVSQKPRLKNGISRNFKPKYAHGDLERLSSPIPYRK